MITFYLIALYANLTVVISSADDQRSVDPAGLGFNVRAQCSGKGRFSRSFPLVLFVMSS